MKIDVKYDYEKETRLKSNGLKTVRNVLFSIIILIILVFLAGSVYTYNLDAHSNKTVVSTPTVDSAQIYRTFTPTAPDPKAAVGAAVQLISSPVARGALASASIKTYPGATCSIKVMYNKVASTETGLGDKLADVYGVVSWDWTIASTVPEGLWPVNVTCSHHTKSGYVQGFVLVTAS